MIIISGVVSGLKKIVRDESLKALYKGNGAQMVRIFPYASTQFTSYEIYKKVSISLFYQKLSKMHSLFQFLTNLSHKSGSNLNFLISGVSGSLAGVTSVFLTYPLDTVRARLAFQVEGSHIYNGIIHAAKTIYLTVSLFQMYIFINLYYFLIISGRRY